LIADHWKAIGAVILLGIALVLARAGCVLPHIPMPGAAPSHVDLPAGSTVEVGKRQIKITPPATPANPHPTPIVDSMEPESKVINHPPVAGRSGWLEITHSGLCLSPFAGMVLDSHVGLTWNVGARVWFSRDLGIEPAFNLEREYLRVDWRPWGWNLLLAGGPAAPLGTLAVDGFSVAANGVVADF